MKRKKSMISKIIALLAAAVMVLSMGMTAFAVQRTATGTITVTGLDTAPSPTVTAYRIITVNVDDASGQPEYPMYTWDAGVAGWLKGNGYETYVDTNNAVTDVFKEKNESGESTVFLEKLAAAIKAGTVNVAYSEQETASGGTAVFDNMPMGVYLLTANGGVKIYQPSTVNLVPTESNGSWTLADKKVDMKSTDPTVTKEAANASGEDKTVAIGDTVNYTIAVDVPDYPEDAVSTKLIVSDKLSSGLTFNKDIIVYSDADKTEVVSQEDYYDVQYNVKIDPEDSEGDVRTFVITFDEDYVKARTATKLYVTYSATVNENAFTTDALGNTAYLGYSNDPYDEDSYKEKEAPEDVFTYGIELTKLDADNQATKLADAEFTLTKTGESNPLKFSGSDGTYKYDKNGSATNVKTGIDGVLRLQGLDEGTYILEEVKAPSGYAIPSGAITIKITDDEPDGTIDEADVSTSGTTNINNPAQVSGNVIKFNVLNNTSSFDLPQTGGAGTVIFTLIGIALMAGAVAMVVLILRKKRV